MGEGYIGREGVSDDERALLLAITQRISEGSSVQGILQAFVDQIAPLIPFDRVEYARVRGDGRELRTEWVSPDVADDPVPVGYVYRRVEPVATSPRYRVPFVDDDLVQYAKGKPPEHPVSLLVAAGYHSTLACPLVHSDSVVGFLFFNSLVAGTYHETHVGIIRVIVSQLAFAVELRRLHRELESRTRELDKLLLTQRQAVGFVSHELRNALTVVSGVAAELEGGGADGSRMEELIPLLRQYASRSGDLAEDLLVAMRDETETLRVVPTTVDLGTEARHVLDAMRLGGVPVERVSGGPVEARADPARVRQIVRNLLSNAGRYGGDGVRVEVEASPEGGPTLRVIDDGEGVTEGFAPRLFEPYAQDVAHSISGSHGLGLAVSHRLMVAMGGTLAYHRVDGDTVFEARFARP